MKPPEINRIMAIADPIARQIADDYRNSAEPLRVWSEHTGALALLFATLLEPLDPPNEAAARDAFGTALDTFLQTLRGDPNRPRQP